jgi:hypothetical protein
MQIHREPRTLLYPVGRKHIAEGAGSESNPSWLPPHKTRTIGNSLHPAKKMYRGDGRATAVNRRANGYPSDSKSFMVVVDFSR